MTDTGPDPDLQGNPSAYWKANLRLVGILMSVWFLVSFGVGILFVDVFNQIKIGGFKLGFWFAQQGSIFAFIALIFVYVVQMRRLDVKFGVDDRDEPDSYDLLDGENGENK
jgi:putative solute:sodium symporter small subunit